MLHLAARAAAAAALALIAAPAPALAQSPKLPAPEVRQGPKLAVPAVPSFELPPAEPGIRSVRELRARGAYDWHGTEITVRGYITWIYDCVKHNARPGETPAQTQKRIDGDQTICERPKFYLGDAQDTLPERSIWVAGVPRPPTRMEQRVLPRDELAKWPAVPKLALGDHVEVTGTWALQSPHGDRNSDGLLVFKSIQPARPARAATVRPAPPAQVRPAPPPKLPSAPPPSPIDPAKRRQSIDEANAGARALALGDLDAAIRAYRASVATWPEHHAAWFYLAYAQMRKQDWPAAVAAVASSTRLAPDVAMYRMIHGVCLYEAARRRAHEAQAAAAGRKPEEITPDLRGVNQDAALAQLALAVHLNKDLWRAHYYIGRIHRDRGAARPAAEALTSAVRHGPPEAAPYAALAELYRRWDYHDQAIQVAQHGVSQAAMPDDKADLLHVLGLARESKGDDAGAVEAYTQALETIPDLAVALFQRGQALARLKRYPAAKADLQKYLAHRAATGFARAMAQRLLNDLAARKP